MQNLYAICILQESLSAASLLHVGSIKDFRIKL